MANFLNPSGGGRDWNRHQHVHPRLDSSIRLRRDSAEGRLSSRPLVRVTETLIAPYFDKYTEYYDLQHMQIGTSPKGKWTVLSKRLGAKRIS